MITAVTMTVAPRKGPRGALGTTLGQRVSIVVPCGRSGSAPTLHVILMLFHVLARLFDLTRFRACQERFSKQACRWRHPHTLEMREVIFYGDVSLMTEFCAADIFRKWIC